MSNHHHHHHHADVEIDWDVMATQLENNGELQLPALQQIAARFKDRHPAVGRIIDIGSGPGVMTGVLAQAFPDAEILAVDGAPGLLERTLTRAERLSVGGRVSTLHAELPEGLDRLGEADLIWSSKAVHHLGDQQGTLDALAGLLRPGGLLAVAEGGLPARFLPRDIGIGRPGLQARLDAMQEHWFQDMRDSLPGAISVIEDWPAMLTGAGLIQTGSHTSLSDLPAPLSDTGRAYLHGHLSRIHSTHGDALDPDDRATLDVLLDPHAPQGILHRPDVYLLSAITVHTGMRPTP